MVASIREAEIADGKIIAFLSGQLGYPISVSETVSNLVSLSESNKDVVYVAVINKAVVGWIHVFHSIKMESKPFCEIAGLVVDESFRGQGVGKLLVDAAKEWSKRTLVEKLVVRTNVVRLATHKFYEQAGFSMVKQQNVYGISLL